MLSVLRRYGDFRRVYLAETISLLGDWFATVALLGLALELTHSQVVASLIFVAQELPTIIFGTIGGAVADRFDRRRIVIVGTTLQGLAAASYLLVGSGTVWIIFAGQFSITLLACFTSPAVSAAIPQMVDPEDVSTALATGSATWGVMVVVGSALGGLMVLAFGRPAVFLTNAATFLVAAALIATVHRPMQGANERDRSSVSLKPVSAIRDVVSFARSTTAIPALMLSRVGFGVAIGMVGLLAPLAATQSTSADAGTAILLAARGAGAAVGPLVGRRVLRRGGSVTLLACGLGCLVMGASYWCVAISPALWITAAAVAMAHFGSSIQFNVATYAVLMRTPDHLRGRVSAFNEAVLTSMTSLSFLGVGLLARPLGTRGSIAVFATWLLLWGCGYLVATRRLRRDASWAVYREPPPVIEPQIV